MLDNKQVEKLIREVYASNGINPPKRIPDREMFLAKNLLETGADLSTSIVLAANSDLKAQNLELLEIIKNLKNEKKNLAVSKGFKLVFDCVTQRPIAFLLAFSTSLFISHVGLRTLMDTVIPPQPCDTIINRTH